MLNLNTIARAKMQSEPYRWTFLENLLPSKQSLELANSYPQEQEDFILPGTVLVRPIISQIEEVKEPSSLNNIWQQLVEELCTNAYRVALGELTGLNLMDDLIYIYFFRYETGNFVGPHLDAPGIRMVQMFYFNQEWDSNWGGCYRILKNHHAKSVFQEISPRLNTSLISVTSDSSWHCVTPVKLEAKQSRQALKVAFIDREDYYFYQSLYARRNKFSQLKQQRYPRCPLQLFN